MDQAQLELSQDFSSLAVKAREPRKRLDMTRPNSLNPVKRTNLNVPFDEKENCTI